MGSEILRNKQLVESYHQATNRKDIDAFDGIFAPNFVNFAAGFVTINNREEMKKTLRELLVAFPDWHIELEDIFGEANKVVVRWKLEATHSGPYQDIEPTGKRITAAGIHIDHIENNLIQKRWACNNFSEIFASLREQRN